MRIAIAGLVHETNTYCQGQTDYDAFYVYRGERMLSASGQESDLGGAIDACIRLGVEIVPILYASTQPSGTIARDAYDAFKDEILEGLAAAGGIDACVLLLHGAGVVDGLEDLEGDLAHAVRQLLGDVPITASFDLHGNVTQFMADQLNGVHACHHYPHIDLHERAADAVTQAFEMATNQTRSQCLVFRVPMLLPTTTTYEGIGQAFLEVVRSAEADDSAAFVSWFHGFPYTDVAHVGSYFVVTHYDQTDTAQRVGNELAQTLWARREEFRATSLSGDEAVELARSTAMQHPHAPVVIHETSDNCGGGAPGDATHLLRSMLAAGLGGDACFAFIVDPEVADIAHAVGVGATIDISLGGKTDELHGAPIETQAYVKALHDGRLIMQAMFRGAPLSIGKMARLVIDDMDVVVASRRSQTFDPEPFIAVGIDVRKYRYVALKSSNHFRAGFADIAGAIVTADTPGLMTHHIEIFPRQKTSDRLWPIDASAQYPLATDIE